MTGYRNAAVMATARGCERALHLLCASLAAILVAVEVGVLFAGVMARYVFHAPLIWSDELASILFLWLAMLGSVIALQRVGAHAADRGRGAGCRPAGQGRGRSDRGRPSSQRSCC